MQKIEITVIVPVYNSKKYLEKCLNSLLNQTYTNFQLILVDDGSTDGSEILCDEYARRDRRIKVIHQRNAGPVNARKNGLKEAVGNYIYYVDSDDWVDENLIEAFADVISRHIIDMVLIGCKREYENGKCLEILLPYEEGKYEKNWIRHEMIPQLLGTDNFYEGTQRLTHWIYLINKRLLLKNQNNVDEKIRICDDAAVIYPCLLDADSMYIKKGIFYHYRQREDSIKKIIDSNEYGRLLLVYEVLVNRFIEDEDRDALLKQAKYLLLYCILLYTSKQLKTKEGVFPYEDFPKGSKVVVYGAGVFGNRVVRELKQNEYADVVAWIDENYAVYQNMETQIDAPEKLLHIEYDYIILGSLVVSVRMSILKKLKEFCISEDKIIDIDMNKIETVPLPDEFENILYNAYKKI